MKQFIVEMVDGCHQCKMKTQSNKCYLTGRRVMKAIKEKKYHESCPGVELQMAKE